jgi:hypothetical protein
VTWLEIIKTEKKADMSDEEYGPGEALMGHPSA